MITGLGKYHTLKVTRESPHGVYLQHGDDEVLLPMKYTEGIKPGNDVDIFLYKDSEDRPVATTEKPLATLGEYAVMEVVGAAPFGVFVDMGLEKHLLVPKQEMVPDMVEGNKYLIRVMFDYKTERLIGVAKIEAYSSVPEDIEESKKVEGIIYQKSDLGFKVWTELNFSGLIYHNQIFEAVYVGDRVTCYTDKIREDGKVDMRLRKGGIESIDDDAQRILDYLNKHNGTSTVTDKSSPDEILEVFGMSKKAFKRAVGSLYKKKLIILKPGLISAS